MPAKDFRTGAIYETGGQARLAFEALVDLPLTHPDITLVEPELSAADHRSAQAAHHTVRRIAQDALPAAGKGAGAGAGIGGIGTALLAAHSPALFISAPVIIALAIAGGGACIGGAIGAGIAFEMRGETLAEALEAASRSGHWCLVIHTRNEQDHKPVIEFLSHQPDVSVTDKQPG